eukprot:COSAG04_NODE_7_length_45988_cov_220.188869_21_plen_212_part_00
MPAPQGAEEGWSVKMGAIAKTAEGKLGVVTEDPDGWNGHVYLRFADGEYSGWIEAASLTQATPSDAGYDALLPLATQVQAQAQVQARLALDVQLCEAAKAGDVAAIERLAGEGVSPDAKNEHGTPAVYCAAAGGHTAAMEALLRLGADPNATRDSGGSTALMEAALRGHAECVRLLLEAGADATLRQWEGKTALELAEARGKTEVAALLRG